MNKILTVSFVSVSLIIVCLTSTNLIYNRIYAEIFEFNENDYYSSGNDPTNSQEKQTNSEDTATEDYSSSDNDPTNSQEKQTNSEDAGKENCITNQEASVLQQASTDSDTYLNNFHFIKKFDKEGNLVDSWGNVGSKNGQFLHAHGITIDSQDNVYVSDAENCNIQKFDKDGNFIINGVQKEWALVNFCNLKVWL